MFNVYQHIIKDGHTYLPYLGSFAVKKEAEWYAGQKLKTFRRDTDYLIIREKGNGQITEIKGETNEFSE